MENNKENMHIYTRALRVKESSRTLKISFNNLKL